MKKIPFSQKFYYYLLYLISIASLSIFAMQFLFIDTEIWENVIKIYSVGGFIYLWYVLILLFRAELAQRNPDQYPRYDNEKITVLIPCYNESPDLFIKTVKSVYQAKGNKEIIIVDDGSTQKNRDHLLRLARKEGITVHYFIQNRGKRHALHFAVKNIFHKTKFVVTIDSDTILDSNALIRLVEPLKLPHIGAVSGNVFLLNERQNLLTRAIGAYYWKALNINRKAQSSLGIVGCCSGCLAAYKYELIDESIDELIQQEFLGELCTYSEDRHLTNLVLKRGFKVAYREEAISYTHSPHTLKPFLRQQMRWRRGFIKESTFTLSYSFKKHPALFFQTLLWDLTLPFAVCGFMLGNILVIAANPVWFLIYILPIWILYALIRGLPLIFSAREKILGMIIFTFLYEFILYWQSIIALITIRKRSWSTR